MPSVHLLLIVLGAWLVSSVLIGMVVGRLLRRREEADRPWRASTGSAGNRGPGRTVTVRTPARRRSGLVRSLAWLLAAAVLVIPPGVALSEDALPGDVLYPLKLALEEARLALETDTADRVTLQLELAARRLQELNRVMDGAPAEVTGELTRRLRRFTRAAASELRWVRAEPGDLVARDQVEAALAAHIEALGDLWDERCARDPDGSCAGVRETMAASRELLGDVRAHRERVAVRSRSRRPTDIEVGPTPPPPAAPAKPSDPPAAEENSTPTASPQPASPEPRRPPAGPTEPTGAGRT
ncbi:MAG: DUF5667 domain-containing protein, partial [Actinomycetota bacterium]|nr:DUF5667 domain-containing protein [Actinomycetota bacterium]